MADDSSLKDFIFLGAGCASLSILMRMIDSGKFFDKKILLIDKEPKIKNDRTWCFWEKENGYFNALVYKQWDALLFKTGSVALPLDIAPYQYKMIRGIDFYNYCFSKIMLQSNIETRYGKVSLAGNNAIQIDGEPLVVNKAMVFNSIYRPAKKEKDKFYLLQHFQGWIIETPEGRFDPHEGTLMDFSIPQNFGTAFIYVLPLTAKKALIEYTLFTENLLPREEYDLQLKKYLEEHLLITGYKITDKEFGVIPMTNVKFKIYGNGMYNIGTAGGYTKPSTGYTFQYIQKNAGQIVHDIIAKKDFRTKQIDKKRFRFYDSTLLHILAKNKLTGKEVFSKLFQHNRAADVFKFLDNDTMIKEELKIINTLPKKEFLIAGIKELLKIF